MIIPNYTEIPLVDPKTGIISDEWKVILQQLLQQLQLHTGEEGFDVPEQSASNMIIVQNAVEIGGNPIAPAGRLLFNMDSINGGGIGSPNGQLYIKLRDGTFHPITNT